VRGQAQRAHTQVADQLAGNFKVAMQLACDAGDHIAVAALLGRV
jgi:hypothetical protein